MDTLTSDSFQSRVAWLRECFGVGPATKLAERQQRFGEEVIKLLQASGLPKAELMQRVDIVYSRPVGEISQEICSVMEALSGLCRAHDLIFGDLAENELARLHDIIEEIRAKRALKPVIGRLKDGGQ